MSAKISVGNMDDQLSEVRYEAAYTYRCGPNGRRGIEIPATVALRFNNGTLRLDIDDARALADGLTVALSEHAATLKDSASGPKAVA
ncbi:hypothetical protein ACFRAQ_02720 [Nocardia sp. NPDC056611]|uniref:hypothetical protein n=1 Tax=Nocardia sp. NPDC056611 TaxID=3345877 RepID=UPI00366EE08C